MEWLLGGSGAVFGVAFIVLAFLNRKDNRETLALRDMLDQEREELRRVRGDLTTETAAHATTVDELRKEKQLRASAEAERNEAYRQGVNHVVDKIKTANIADAQRLVAGLLAEPLPGFVPAEVPASRSTAPGPDSLLNPFPVQPPSDP